MKNIISLLLALAICLSLVACGKEPQPTEVPTETPTEAPTEPIVKIALEEQVSTDIIDFTLIDAEFTIACVNHGSKRQILRPTEYNEAEHAGSLYVAPKGHTLVTLTFEVTNTNRTPMNMGGPFTNWSFFWNVGYGEQEYNLTNIPITTGIPPSAEFDLQPYYVVYNDKVFEDFLTGYLLDPQETVKVRTVGMIDTDVENLADSFDFIITIPNSSGELEEFIYAVE